MVNNVLHTQLGRIRRRAWIVTIIMVIFLLGGVGSALMGQTTYSSKAALGASSQTRSPEQDAILAQGYANFFNDPVYQSVLRARAKVPSDVSFTAETVAASPLIYITATSTNESDVRGTSAKMAMSLFETVNDALTASKNNTISAVRKPFDDIRSANGVIPEQALIQMEDRISQISADTTNQLQVLQMNSGVSSTSPNALTSIGLALFAGVVAGCAVALVMGALTRRVDSALDLREKTGLDVLAFVPRGDVEQRGRRYAQLANALTGAGSTVPEVIAVASVTDLTGTARVARAIAAHRSDQGARVIVLDADLREPGTSRALAEYLGSNGRMELDGLIRSSDQHAGVLEFGRGRNVAGVRAIDAARLKKLLAELGKRADLVVVIAPPVVQTADSQVVCAAADSTLLVIERSVTRTADVVEGKRLLEQVDGAIAGAVLIEKGAEEVEPTWVTADSAGQATKPASTLPDSVSDPTVTDELEWDVRDVPTGPKSMA